MFLTCLASYSKYGSDKNQLVSKFTYMHSIFSVFFLLLDVNECLDNKGNCSDNCINTPGSYHCECPTGYILQPNKRDCEGEYTYICILLA